MQENTESEKPKESDNPESQEEIPEEGTAPETELTQETDPNFEEQEGEILPPEKKKGSGCGLILFVILLLTGGGGYLYYTNQIPPQISKQIEPLLQQIEPLLKPLKEQLAKLNPEPAPQAPKIRMPKVKETIPTPQVPKEIPVVERKPEIASAHLPEEHVSGTETILPSKVDEENSSHPAQVSGNTTKVEPESEDSEEEAKTIIEEPIKRVQVEKAVPPVVAPAPIVTTPHQASPVFEEPSAEESMKEEPEETERNEAVQAYLDFVEATVIKISELIKAGFTQAKDFLMKSLG